VEVHPFTLSHTPKSMNRNSRASLLACTFIGLYLGFATKAKACKNARQEGSPKSTSYTLGNAGECERMNPHTPK